MAFFSLVTAMIRKRSLESNDSHVQAPKRQLLAAGNTQNIIPLVRNLLLKWSWGVISATCLQEIAHDAVLSGLEDDNIILLSGVGASGTNNKQHRDLLRLYCQDMVVPPPLKFEIPALDPKGNSSNAIMTETKFFLPSQWLTSLATESLQFEFEALVGSTATLEAFWAKQELIDPKWNGHPLFKKKNYRQKALPVLLHGDGASYQSRDSLMTVSFTGLLKEGRTLDTNLVLAAWPKSTCSKDIGGTWDTIWSWIVWDFNQLFHNKYSDTNPWGDPLPSELAHLAGKPIMKDGFFVVVVGTAGDNDYFQNDLGTPHWRNVLPKPCCHLCQGNKAGNNWFNFGAEAAWKKTPAMSCPSKHPITKIIGWTAWHFHLDWMHSVDLGCAGHAIGNLLFEIVYVSLKHKSRTEACQEIAGVLIDQSSGLHGSAISSFVLKNFVADTSRPHQDYPELRKLKAAEVRSLVKPAVFLAIKYSDGSNLWKHRIRMIRALDLMYEVIYAADIVLTHDQFQSLDKSCNLFLQEYSFLARAALEATQMQYSIAQISLLGAHCASC